MCTSPRRVCPPVVIVPSTSPRTTDWPAATTGATGSSVVTKPEPWSTVSRVRPATGPAKAMTPSAGETTAVPTAPARSMPR